MPKPTPRPKKKLDPALVAMIGTRAEPIIDIYNSPPIGKDLLDPVTYGLGGSDEQIKNILNTIWGVNSANAGDPLYMSSTTGKLYRPGNDVPPPTPSPTPTAAPTPAANQDIEAYKKYLRSLGFSEKEINDTIKNLG